MKIVQSVWACKNKNLLEFNAGWHSPEYNLMSIALSCLQLSKYYEVTIYTDSIYEEMLIDVLKLPYSESRCELNSLDLFSPFLWALPKIRTYGLQDKPFLHVDCDVFIWKAFDSNLLSAPLIAQNMEFGTSYYQSIIKELENKLIYLPEEILQERNQCNDIYAYNAGIFGGYDLTFFTEYSKKAFEFVEKNNVDLNIKNLVSFNVIFEQYLFYCLAKAKKKKVSVLFEGLINDTSYKGFSDFSETPYNKNYLHLLGTYKTRKTACDEMASCLRELYPEYYYRIITLFQKSDLKLFKEYFFFSQYSTEQDLVINHQKLKDGFKKNTLKCMSDSDEITSEMNAVKSITGYEKKTIGIEEFIVESDMLNYEDQKELDLFLDEFSLLADAFKSLSMDYLYARDINFINYFPLLFDRNLVGEKYKIIKDDHVKLTSNKYPASLLTESYQDNSSKEDLADEKVFIALVPECDKIGFSLHGLDDLDSLILNSLTNPFFIDSLLEYLKMYFDKSEIESDPKVYESLINGRIKKLVKRKIIKLYY